MIIKNGDMPAYPQDLQGRRSDNPDFAGMTKREHFAGLAMQGLCSTLGDPDARKFLVDRAYQDNIQERMALSRVAIEYADALLAELAKTEEA